MIPRYEKTKMTQIWADQNKFETYLKVELAILQALEGTKVPQGISAQIRSLACVNPARIDEIEKETKHDVIAFCTSITENMDPEIAKYFHFGVTSSDIIDTSLSLQLKQSLELILASYKKLLSALNKKAHDTKDILTMGRSHGMYAEPLSFGQKLLGHYCEFARHFKDLTHFYNKDLTGQFSGAVGNYTLITPEQEKNALENLGLKVESVSTQIIPRDRIAKMISLTSLVASAIERIAVEIRHLHRSDVSEVHEGFKKGQKGSSTMPHKKNPISAENLSGLARYLRSHLSIALENNILWHERDISHSSAERMFLPDHLGILLYAIDRLTETIENLIVHQDKIEQRVEENFVYLSSFFLHKLIEKSNFSREDLYKIIQEASFNAKSSTDFIEKILKIAAQKQIDLKEFDSPNFEVIKKMYTSGVDDVFSRVQKEYPLP